MKQIEAIKAFLSLVDLNKQKMNDAVTARKIYNLFNALKPSYDFQLQEEQKIYEAHPDYDYQTGGLPISDNTEEERNHRIAEAKEIREALKAIGETEIEPITFEPFTINLSNENIKISGEDIGNLQNFITFE